MHVSRGGCHCGNLSTRFASPAAPADSVVRACQCSFCRKHGVRAVADAEGSAEIAVRDPDKLVRYTFGHKSAEFLVCGSCGVYVAALMTDGDDAFATMIVNAFENQADYPAAAEPVSYDAEDAEAKRQRRRRVWTPATLVIGAG